MCAHACLRNSSSFLDLHHCLPNYFLNVRSVKKSEEDIPVPPLIKSAVLWGMHYFIIYSCYRLSALLPCYDIGMNFTSMSVSAFLVPLCFSFIWFWLTFAVTCVVYFNNSVFFLSPKLPGVFLAVSSNTRYQIINGLERLVEASPMAKQIPPVALAFTVGVRFANNIYGGMQFVDWARWSGVQ